MSTATIKQTKDYTMFKKHDSNRTIDNRNLNRIIESIKEEDLLAECPIIIDKDGRVVDGQHRLEAAKILGKAIYYIESDGFSSKAMNRLNTAKKSWALDDFLNNFCAEGHEDYIKLQDFIKKEKLPLNIAIQLFAGHRSKSLLNEFKEGKFKFPNEKDFEECLVKLIQINEIREYIRKKTIGTKSYLDRVTFSEALINFFNIKSFEYKVFINKLQYKVDMMHPCTSIGDYLKLFKEIYNWYNSKPISDS